MKLIENDTSVMKTYQPVGKTIHHPKNDTSIYYIRFGTRDFAGRSCTNSLVWRVSWRNMALFDEHLGHRCFPRSELQCVGPWLCKMMRNAHVALVEARRSERGAQCLNVST